MEKKKIERVSYKQLTANRRIRCVNSSNTCRAGKCSNLYDPRRQGALRWYSATSRGTVNGYVYQVPGTLEYVSRGRLIVYPSSRRAARGVEDGRAFRRKQKTTGTLSFAWLIAVWIRNTARPPRPARWKVRVAVTNRPFLWTAVFGRGCVGNAWRGGSVELLDVWDAETFWFRGFFVSLIGLLCMSFFRAFSLSVSPSFFAMDTRCTS